MSMVIADGEYTDQWRCDWCGRFIGQDGDQFTVWGSASYDPPEPHDPTDVCGRCRLKLYNSLWEGLVKRGLPVHENRSYWCSPVSWEIAKGVYRGMTRHGLLERPVRHEVVRREIRYGRDQLWYCGNCGRPEKHPGHDPKEAYRLKVKACYKFQRQRGIWIAPNYGRQRCACGWASPWETGWSIVSEPMQEHFKEHRPATVTYD